MVANPNSNLVFDFPDPTPRFEFNDSPTKNATATSAPPKKSTRFGKFVRSRVGGKADGASASSASPSKASVGSSGGTAATESLNASLDSTFDSAGTAKARNGTGGGDVAGGPSSGGYAVPHFDLQQAPPKLNLPAKASPPQWTSKHGRNPSLANSETGYISEVSEFSFDRVTVTTQESGVTGKSSTINWSFADDQGVLAAVGAIGGGQKDEKFAPYTGEAEKAGAKAATGKNGEQRGKSHEKKVSSSTFSNVSVSDDEMDHIPMSGIVGSSQSVVSDMSERTGGGNTAVKALLKEGMATVRAKEEEAKEPSPGRETRAHLLQNIGRAAAATKANSRGTPPTVDSTPSIGSEQNFFRDVKETYKQFKTSRNGGRKEKGSILQSIVEDLQFCGLYFCGIDTTYDEGETGGKYEDMLKRKKEDRKREADDTFLGKVISCGSEHVQRCGMCVEL